jgi:hypothetical protein
LTCPYPPGTLQCPRRGTSHGIFRNAGGGRMTMMIIMMIAVIIGLSFMMLQLIVFLLF